VKPPKSAQVIEAPNSTYWFEDGILFVVTKKAPPLSLEDQKRVTEEFIRKLNGKKICAVMDVTNSSPSPRPNREYSSKLMPEVFKAIAFIARNPVGRMMANLYFTYTPFPFEHKVFKNEKEARDWIKQFV
jgi:hypothetical protein